MQPKTFWLICLAAGPAVAAGQLGVEQQFWLFVEDVVQSAHAVAVEGTDVSLVQHGQETLFYL